MQSGLALFSLPQDSKFSQLGASKLFERVTAAVRSISIMSTPPPPPPPFSLLPSSPLFVFPVVMCICLALKQTSKTRCTRLDSPVFLLGLKSRLPGHCTRPLMKCVYECVECVCVCVCVGGWERVSVCVLSFLPCSDVLYARCPGNTAYITHTWGLQHIPCETKHTHTSHKAWLACLLTTHYTVNLHTDADCAHVPPCSNGRLGLFLKWHYINKTW